MKHGFKVGDRVVRNSKTGFYEAQSVKIGEIGTVKRIHFHILVEWENSQPFRHSGAGLCKDFHGWNVEPGSIDLLPSYTGNNWI